LFHSIGEEEDEEEEEEVAESEVLFVEFKDCEIMRGGVRQIIIEEF
jgi:hypothetical protein